jgi:hypothetical protein
LRQAPEAKAEPGKPEGVELGEFEAMVRRVVAEELRKHRVAVTAFRRGRQPKSHAGEGRRACGSIIAVLAFEEARHD